MCASPVFGLRSRVVSIDQAGVIPATGAAEAFTEAVASMAVVAVASTAVVAVASTAALAVAPVHLTEVVPFMAVVDSTAVAEADVKSKR